MTVDEPHPGWIEGGWPVAGPFRVLTSSRGTDAMAAADQGALGGEPVSVPGTSAGREWLRRTTVGASGHLQWLRQVHGNRCVRATFDSCSTAPQADAVWTDAAGLGLAIQTADCVPVVVADRQSGRIGAAHGGWRGLAGGVVGRLVAAMGPSSGLAAWIGPAIGWDAYEVGEDVRSAMRSAFGRSLVEGVCTPGVRPGRWQLDLFGLTVRLLHAAGVGEVGGERLCTLSDPRFHSHRRDGTSGRMATLVWKPLRASGPVRRPRDPGVFIDMSAQNPKNSPLSSNPV